MGLEKTRNSIRNKAIHKLKDTSFNNVRTFAEDIDKLIEELRADVTMNPHKKSNLIGLYELESTKMTLALGNLMKAFESLSNI